MATPALAGSQTNLRESPDGTHYIVDEGSKLAEAIAPMERPVPGSTATVDNKQSLGNLHLDLSASADCGYGTANVLVVCLDMDYQIQPVDRLRALAFADRPLQFRAGSMDAYKAIYELLNARRSVQGEAVGVVDGTCTGACGRRITLEHQ